MNHRVILIVIDACRPDGLAQASTPNLDRLCQTGAYTMTGRTVLPSYTLPCHMSMFRGVSPEEHGVTGNVAVPLAYEFPSIMDVAHAARLRTAMFHSWEELRDLNVPGSLSASYHRAFDFDEDTDRIVTQKAVEYIIEERPDLILVYLAEVDLIGHAYTWMSEQYLRAIENSDRTIGYLLDSLESVGIRSEYTILTLADHGGLGHTHGEDTPEEMTIPWILNGPGIRQGHEIQTQVMIYDTAATLAHLLGLTAPAIWQGKPVLEAFEPEAE